MYDLEKSSDESPEQETSTAETPAPEQKGKTLADLLNDEPPETGNTDPPNGGDAGKAAEKHPKAKPLKALSDLAERLELKPDALYAIEIPMADGKTLSIGKLKDLAAASGDLETERFKFEESRTQRENELIRAQQEMQTILSALPKTALKPEILEQARAKHESTLTRERARTLEVIPEWRDEARRTADLTGMVEWLKSYGYPANYLQSVYDHRTVRFLRDNWQRAERVRKALEQVQKQTPATPGKSKPNGKAPRAPAQQRGGKSSSSGAQYAALLNE